MSASTNDYQHGNAVQSDSDTSKYTGVNRSEYPKWIMRLNLKLTLNKQKPWIKDLAWIQPKQSEYRKREDQLIDEDNFTQQDEDDGFQIGDYRISLSLYRNSKRQYQTITKIEHYLFQLLPV